jgi:hypothetical protein
MNVFEKFMLHSNTTLTRHHTSVFLVPELHSSTSTIPHLIWHSCREENIEHYMNITFIKFPSNLLDMYRGISPMKRWNTWNVNIVTVTGKVKLLQWFFRIIHSTWISLFKYSPMFTHSRRVLLCTNKTRFDFHHICNEKKINNPENNGVSLHGNRGMKFYILSIWSGVQTQEQPSKIRFGATMWSGFIRHRIASKWELGNKFCIS